MVKLRISNLEIVAGDVAVIDLDPDEGVDLSSWTPGAHIDLHLGSGLIRQYSLCGQFGVAKSWQLAVRRDPHSRGGSKWLHESASPGMLLDASAPRNNFPLVPAERYVFLAGGIGVTPFLPMVEQAVADGVPTRVAFGATRSLYDAFGPRLSATGAEVELFDAADGPLPIAELVADVTGNAMVYCCGPAGMIDATRQIAVGDHPFVLHVEQFTPVGDSGVNRPVTVELARSGFHIEVPGNMSILDAVLAQDVFVTPSCREGTCGSCEVAVLAGQPDHRDAVTDPDDPDRDLSMMICVSRAFSDRLVLDL